MNAISGPEPRDEPILNADRSRSRGWLKSVFSNAALKSILSTDNMLSLAGGAAASFAVKTAAVSAAAAIGSPVIVIAATAGLLGGGASAAAKIMIERSLARRRGETVAAWSDPSIKRRLMMGAAAGIMGGAAGNLLMQNLDTVKLVASSLCDKFKLAAFGAATGIVTTAASIQVNRTHARQTGDAVPSWISKQTFKKLLAGAAAGAATGLAVDAGIDLATSGMSNGGNDIANLPNDLAGHVADGQNSDFMAAPFPAAEPAVSVDPFENIAASPNAEPIVTTADPVESIRSFDLGSEVAIRPEPPVAAAAPDAVLRDVVPETTIAMAVPVPAEIPAAEVELTTDTGDLPVGQTMNVTQPENVDSSVATPAVDPATALEAVLQNGNLSPLARETFTRALQGNAMALKDAGHFLSNGLEGVAQDQQLAAAMFRQAADQNDNIVAKLQAMTALTFYERHGLGGIAANPAAALEKARASVDPLARAYARSWAEPGERTVSGTRPAANAGQNGASARHGSGRAEANIRPAANEAFTSNSASQLNCQPTGDRTERCILRGPAGDRVTVGSTVRFRPAGVR